MNKYMKESDLTSFLLTHLFLQQLIIIKNLDDLRFIS